MKSICCNRTSLITFLLSLVNVCVLSQVTSKELILDSVQVINIAKSRKAYWVNESFPTPMVKFDESLQEWKVLSTRTKHINRGRCKFTNGCTEITQLILTIDAETGKVKSRKKQKKLFYNYE